MDVSMIKQGFINPPTFLGIGAAKCGTTTLASYLQRHPQIALPGSGRKELHFFDEQYVDAVSVDAYRAMFKRPDKTEARAWGEFTPSYLYDPKCPGLIRRWLGPDLRLLVILRDPVDRAWSHYCHAVRTWGEPVYRERGYPIENLEFLEAIEAEPARLAKGEFHIRHQSYYSKGLYAEQLERWMEQYAHEQIHVLLLDDLVRNCAQTLEHVYSFLGVDPTLMEVPSASLRLNSKSIGCCPAEARRVLAPRYRDDVERLEALLGRDLSHWRRVDAASPAVA